MPAGSDGDDPSKDEKLRKQTIWPEDQRMEVQQNAANRMFRSNSEDLQRGQATGRTEQAQNTAMAYPVNKDQERGNYSQLKQAHAAETNRTSDGRGGQNVNTQKSGPIREDTSVSLTFAKNAGRTPNQTMAQESGRQDGTQLQQRGAQQEEKLDFAKHRTRQDRSQLKQEHAKEVSREAKAPQRNGQGQALQFAKHNSRGGRGLGRG
jgi:hypothetical protein